MKEYEHKKRWRKLVYSPVTLLVLLMFVFLMSKGVYGMYQKYHLAKESLDEENARLEQLESQHSKLQKDLRLLDTEDGEESVIRDRFRVVKPGEELVVVIEEDGEATATVVEE